MKKFLSGLVLALAATMSFATDFVASAGTDSVTARQAACPASVLQHIEPEQHARFRLANGVFEGKAFVGCWTVEEGLVYIVWEDGDFGIIPESEFRPLREV